MLCASDRSEYVERLPLWVVSKYDTAVLLIRTTDTLSSTDLPQFYKKYPDKGNTMC